MIDTILLGLCAIAILIVIVVITLALATAAKESRQYKGYTIPTKQRQAMRCDIFSRILYIATMSIMLPVPIYCILHSDIILLSLTCINFAPFLVMMISAFMANFIYDMRASTHLISWAACVYYIVIAGILPYEFGICDYNIESATTLIGISYVVCACVGIYAFIMYIAVGFKNMIYTR